NTDGFLTFQNDYHWNADIDKWIISYTSEYQWDQYGNKIIVDNRSFFPDLNMWQGVDKNQYAYDEKGNKLLYYDFHWDQVTNKWLEFSKYNYTYDENGNLIDDLWQRYLDFTTNKYAEVFKSNFSYDTSLNVSEVLMPPLSYFIRPEYAESTVNKPLNYTHYALIEDVWQSFEKGTYYYSNQEVSNVSTQISNKGVKVYPNPASGFIKFEIKDDLNPLLVELYDLNGKKVLSQKHLPKDQITVRQLRPGIYFYKLTRSNEIHQGKVVIK
ncbi:MAG TPA: T9SS type A sorting domain-containing protein, partial [Prolixibacteraceae bacterium]|nr:T9SS type A sorting domain-containing protein [Prolixibacteraceae bacterium]